MAIYFIYYGVLLAVGVLFQWLGVLQKKGGRIFYLVLVAATLTMVSGARSFDVSYDGRSYASAFRTFSESSGGFPPGYNNIIEY